MAKKFARVQIVIEDMPNGTVKVSCDPSFSELVQMDVSGSGLAPAHLYAMDCLIACKQRSDGLKPSAIALPKRLILPPGH